MKPVLFLLATLFLGLAPPVAARAQKPSDDPLERALAHMQAGENDKAIADLSELIKRQPNNADAYFLLSNLKETSGDVAGALADINRAIELKPETGWFYYNRAIMRLVGKDAAGALKDLDLAVANNYKVDPVYSLRAQLRTEQEDLKGALADWDESIRLNPDDPRAYYSRASLLIKLGDEGRALADLNYLLKWYETNPVKRPAPKAGVPEDKQAKGQDARPAPAEKEEQTKSSEGFKVESALETVNASPADKEMIPVIAAAYEARGAIYSLRGNSDAAISDFTKATKVLPTDSWAFFQRAMELEGKGDLDGALSDVNKAIELEPRNGNARVERGVLLSLRGKNAEAQVEFDLLLKSDRALWQKRIEERTEAVKKKLPGRPN